MLFKIWQILFKDAETILAWHDGYEDGYRQALEDEKYRRRSWYAADSSDGVTA